MYPLNTPQKDVATLFSVYKKAVVGSQNNIKTFRTQWHSPEIQTIFEHGKQSLNDNPDLSESASVLRYGWKQSLDARPKAAPPKKRRHSLIEDEPAHVGEGDLGSIVEGFRNKYQQIKVETKDNGHDIRIQLMTAGTRLKFHIVVGQGPNNKGKLRAECLGTTKLQTAVSRSIASRPQANDLEYLLVNIIICYSTS